MKKRRIKKKVRYCIFCVISLICLGIIAFAGNYLYNTLKDYSYKNIYTTYSVDGNVDYKVYLKENDFIKKEYLGIDQSYINKLVNYISADFKFDYQNSDENYVGYNYTITGVLSGNYIIEADNEKQAKVWTEEEILSTKTVETTSLKNINILENFTINTKSLNNRVTEFQTELGIPITADYQIIMSINLLFTDELGNIITNTHKTYIDIPIGPSVFNITRVNDKESNLEVLSNVEEKNLDKEKLVISISLLAFGVLIMLITIKKTFKQSKDEYETEREQILNIYGDRIVEVENLPSIKNSEIIELTNFEEMVDLVNELNLPILCWYNNSDTETKFVVININIMYSYIIKK